jgi:hypothetical protein
MRAVTQCSAAAPYCNCLFQNSMVLIWAHGFGQLAWSCACHGEVCTQVGSWQVHGFRLWYCLLSTLRWQMQRVSIIWPTLFNNRSMSWQRKSYSALSFWILGAICVWLMMPSRAKLFIRSIRSSSVEGPDYSVCFSTQARSFGHAVCDTYCRQTWKLRLRLLFRWTQLLTVLLGACSTSSPYLTSSSAFIEWYTWSSMPYFSSSH